MCFKATVSSFLFVFLFSTPFLNATAIIVGALSKMFVADALREHAGEIIDQSGCETHGAHVLFISCVYMCACRLSPYNTLYLHNVS